MNKDIIICTFFTTGKSFVLFWHMKGTYFKTEAQSRLQKKVLRSPVETRSGYISCYATAAWQSGGVCWFEVNAVTVMPAQPSAVQLTGLTTALFPPVCLLSLPLFPSHSFISHHARRQMNQVCVQ